MRLEKNSNNSRD